MSSTIEIKKICQCCGVVFIARKTTTKYCSHKCASIAYKANKREELVGLEAMKIEKELQEKKILEVETKPMLTVTEAALLIGVSRPTIYAYIRNGELYSMRLGSKIFVRLSDIHGKFNAINLNHYKPIQEDSSILEWYTISEIKEKYNVKDSWIYKIIREEQIPKTTKRGKAFYSKKHIDSSFSKKTSSSEITSWYSAEEIQKFFNMTTTAIYSFVYENKIPKKKEGKKAFYSKDHFDVAKGLREPEEPKYYTTSEAMKKYNLTRDQLYHYVKYHNIPKVKEGRCIKISRVHLDELFDNPIIL